MAALAKAVHPEFQERAQAAADSLGYPDVKVTAAPSKKIARMDGKLDTDHCFMEMPRPQANADTARCGVGCPLHTEPSVCCPLWRRPCVLVVVGWCD